MKHLDWFTVLILLLLGWAIGFFSLPFCYPAQELIELAERGL